VGSCFRLGGSLVFCIVSVYGMGSAGGRVSANVKSESRTAEQAENKTKKRMI